MYLHHDCKDPSKEKVTLRDLEQQHTYTKNKREREDFFINFFLSSNLLEEARLSNFISFYSGIFKTQHLVCLNYITIKSSFSCHKPVCLAWRIFDTSLG